MFYSFRFGGGRGRGEAGGLIGVYGLGARIVLDKLGAWCKSVRTRNAG